MNVRPTVAERHAAQAFQAAALADTDLQELAASVLLSTCRTIHHAVDVLNAVRNDPALAIVA